MQASSRVAASAVVRRLLAGRPGPRRRCFVSAPGGSSAFRPLHAGQVRFARRRKSIVEEDGVEELPKGVGAPAGGPTKEEDDEQGEFELPEVPADILDAWEKDEMAQEALSMFSSEELRGKGVMNYRDVARMLELMGCDRLTFLRMLSAEGDEDDEFEGKGGKGKGKGMGAMSEQFEDDFMPAKGGKNGYKGSKGKLDFDDSDDDFGAPPKGGKKGYKGSKGKMDFDDDDDFGGFKGGGKGKGGKGGRKGKGKGKGGFDFDY